MSEDLVLTEELKASIKGRQSDPVSTLVERGAIRRFAEAIGDDNPLFSDEVQAQQGRYGDIIAPPTFLRSLRSGDLQIQELDSLTRVLDGGSGWTYLEPVRPGDTITAVVQVATINQRRLSVGPAVFLVAETSYTNQLGQVVATQRSTIIRY